MDEARRGRTQLLFVLAFALTFPTVMTWAYFVAGGDSAKFLYGVGKVIQFALPVAWWALADRSRFRLLRPRADDLIIGAIFGLLVAAGIVILYLAWLRHHPAIEPLAAEARQKTAAFGLNSPGRYLFFALFLSLIHALLEEYYWRAFVFAELRRFIPFAAAVAISSAGFLAHHAVLLWVYFPGRFWTLAVPFALAVGIGGAVWAWLYQRGGTILALWLSHALVDAGLMVVGFFILWH